MTLTDTMNSIREYIRHDWNRKLKTVKLTVAEGAPDFLSVDITWISYNKTVTKHHGFIPAHDRNELYQWLMSKEIPR